MLCKSVCMKCMDELIEAGIGVGPWHEVDEGDWQRGSVWCPPVGNERTVYINENPPPECVRKFEHAVAAGMAND